MATIHEIQGDLFDLPHGYVLAHCVSADFAMGAGIAKTFAQKYPAMRNYLITHYFDLNDPDNYVGPGAYPYLDVFNLVTKRRVWEKPTYVTLRTALEDLKRYAEEMSIDRLAMPRIGCGLDRLEWDQVKPIIEEVFAGLDIQIVICVL